MAKEKKYYWIKLKDEFINCHEMDELLLEKDGGNCFAIYVKLCLLTKNSNGLLHYETNLNGNMILKKYEPEKIQRELKVFNLGTIMLALAYFQKYGLVFTQLDGTMYIKNHDKMVGYEQGSADRVRRFREKKKQELLSAPENLDSNTHAVTL